VAERKRLPSGSTRHPMSLEEEEVELFRWKDGSPAEAARWFSFG
jgi:hypothetical protein